MVQTEIQDLQPLFEDVQMNRVFPDGKTFVDCLPKHPLEEINNNYIRQKNNSGFNLEKFVLENFELPVPHSNGYHTDFNKSMEENIENLWTVLTRQPDKKLGSLIPLPFPYIVPGGRFGEIYYWDSYFTMLGLKVSGKLDMLESMVKNFAFLLDTVGHIPNGNRTYYLSRSQPPFFSLMLKLLDKEDLVKYLPQLEKEYQYWMRDAELLSADKKSICHVTQLPGGEILNRYWDEADLPRPEAFKEDLELSHESEQHHLMIYRHLRAGAESGWDFSSRWFRDGKSFSTIQTSDIVPVDLNCLLLHLEQTIAEAYLINEDLPAARAYQELAEKRIDAIQKYCWKEDGFFVDYDTSVSQQKTNWTLAGAFPLFFEIASQEQANAVASGLQEKFLAPGGLTTTLINTGQQWDAPNGWAPLQWMSIIGLENYGHHALAKDIAARWTQLNANVFKRTGKLMEKYNVVDVQLEAGGGEYAGQDGFGWTNGVLLALMEKYGS